MEDRSSSITRWLLIGAGLIVVMWFGPRLWGGSSAKVAPLALEDWGTVPDGERPEPTECTLTGTRSDFVFTSRGAALVRSDMHDRKYAVSVDKPGEPTNLVTNSKEQRMPLRTSLRAPSSETNQVPFDNLDFKLTSSSPSECTFEYVDADTRVTKVVRLTERPFEVDQVVTVENLSLEPKAHRFAIEQATWRTKKETQSSFWDLGRRPEWLTDVTTATSTGVFRGSIGDFEPDDFEAKNGFTEEHWKRSEGDGSWAAVGSNYFTTLVIHRDGPKPKAEALIEDGAFYKLHPDDPNYGHMYRARLAYPETTLSTGEKATYSNVAYLGPKEREVLATVGGLPTSEIKATEIIDLGMFAALGKIAVGYVHWLFGLVKSWGWAICLLTISVKLLVFPLQLPQLKTTVAMRRVKPEVDAINAKYSGDMMQKNLALQELHKREGIRPALGCIPLLLQMPVWFALYQSLATAVELYHEPFGPFIPDLTSSDPYHIIPIVLGGSSFLQQRLMPPQGMDPAQQRMMMYMMPGIFTAMMFFLPAGLGVYMMTNTWLGIIQQLLVERWVQSKLGSPATIEVREVKKGDSTSLEKGKVRARG